LRPVSSFTLALDHLCFGRQALPAHVHSLLWMLLLAFLASRLYTRWFSARAAWLSALVFAVSGVHGVPTAWLASRHTLIGAALGASALLYWLRFREDAFKPGRWLATLLLALSLFASESALGAVVLLAGYELETRGLRRGLLGAAPHLLLGLAYLAVYAALGYGARGSGFYVSPFDSPLRYALTALLGVPALLVELLMGLPSAVAGLVAGAQTLFVVLGLAATLGCGALLYILRNELPASSRRTLSWLTLATFVSLWALVGAVVTGRVLPLAMLGAAAVIGNSLSAAWSRFRPSSSETPGRKRWLVPILLFSLLHFGVSPLVRVSSALQFRGFARAQRELAQRAELGACKDHGFVYLLTGADPILALSTAAALAFYTPEKAGAERFRVLSMAPQEQRLQRVAPNAFELSMRELPRRSNAFESLYRAPENPLRAGQHYRAEELSSSVLAADSGVFTKARFELEPGVDASKVCLLVWKEGWLQQAPLPKAGQSTAIPYEVGPMGM
jgi:hypothetical protein